MGLHIRDARPADLDRLEELEEVEADFNQNVTYIVAKHNLQVRSW